MSAHISSHRAGFDAGLTVITLPNAPDNPSAIGLAVLRLAAGESLSVAPRGETAWLLMSGSVAGAAGGAATSRMATTPSRHAVWARTTAAPAASAAGSPADSAG